jgi:hypothetical protein
MRRALILWGMLLVLQACGNVSERPASEHPGPRAWVLWVGGSPDRLGGDITEWNNAVAAFDRKADCEAAPRRSPVPSRGITWVFGCFPSETHPRGER